MLPIGNVITLRDQKVTYNQFMDNENSVFKALSDESRRTLLDQLFRQDGQTLSELESHLDMSRFGVMKHLRILEEANLITTEKVGREKHHYLNSVPIQLVYDRWVNKFSRRWTESLADLKYQLEAKAVEERLSRRYQIFIRTTPDALWHGLTSPELTAKWYHGCPVYSDWQQGSRYESTDGDRLLLDGEILEIDPPYKLVQTFVPHWRPEAEELGESKNTWLIEQQGAICKLTLIHDDLKNTPEGNYIIESWSQLLSALKTLLETATPLEVQNSLI
ncbi:MAG: SRPBCC domain-containing protein [Chloroflexota bacterium]